MLKSDGGGEGNREQLKCDDEPLKGNEEAIKGDGGELNGDGKELQGNGNTSFLMYLHNFPVYFI